MAEEWRPVVGWESWYEVSSRGRVRRRETGYVRKLALFPSGYFYVGLRAPGRRLHYKSVHGLVAAAFLGPRIAGQEVNHISGVKSENVVENLEYLTRGQNARHAARLGLLARGMRNGAHAHPERRSHPTIDRSTAALIRDLHVRGGRNGSALARQFNVSIATVSNIINHQHWTDRDATRI